MAPAYKDMPISEMEQISELARSINEDSDLMLLIIIAAFARRSINRTQEELLSQIQEMSIKHVSKVNNSNKSYSENPRLLHLACVFVALLRKRQISALNIDNIDALDYYEWDNEFFNIKRNRSLYRKSKYHYQSTVPAEHVLNLAHSINRDTDLVAILILWCYGRCGEEWEYEEIEEEIHQKIHEHVQRLGYDYPHKFSQLNAAYVMVARNRVKKIAALDMSTLKEYAENRIIGQRIVF